MLDTVDSIGDKISRFAGFEAADIIAAKHRGTSQGGKLECFACGKSIGTGFETGPAHALQQHRLACFAQQLI